MGPVATLEFYARLIAYSQVRYGAVQDSDYPPIVIHSLSLHGTDETGIVDSDLVYEELASGVAMLGASEVDFIVIPCNTIHTLLAKLRSISTVPILSMVEETTDLVKRSCLESVGLLASKTTCDDKVYLLNKLKVPTGYEQSSVSKVILHVMGGNNSSSDKQVLLDIIERMKVDGVVLGCTELSVVLRQQDIGVKVFDALEVLARRAIDLAYSTDVV